MTSKIRVLTDHTINKIAAGEVIENPASVVKELVENSIDAGAKDICVEIKGGGRQLIRISDDGSGMNADDALLCLERHATSKIREVEDIHSVTTMGFRGEAIPSIASISKFMLLTSPQLNGNTIPQEDAHSGTMVIVDGGKIVNCSPAARSPGTTVEVKSLFFNVPVRRKFLKSPAVDTNEILKILSLIALGYPNIKFQLINDGKTMLSTTLGQDTSFADSLNTRIENVLGPEYLQNTISIMRESNGMSLQGVIGYPNYTRHNRTGQFLFINNRGVFSPLVAYAVKEGYGSALPSGRHPVFVLHLALSGNLVDVNVHPQKREVRLRQEQLLKELIIKAIEQSLQHNPNHKNNFFTPDISPVFTRAFETPEAMSTSNNNDWIFQPKSLTPWSKPEPTPQNSLSQQDHLPAHQPVVYPSISPHQPPAHTPSFPQKQPIEASLHIPVTSMPPRVIATIPRYILLDASSDNEFFSKAPLKAPNSSSRGLLLIDQKAAHSRIIFEKLQQRNIDSPISQQSLLIPYTLEVSPFEADTLRDSISTLNHMGFQIQEFGSDTFLIDAIPQIIGTNDIKLLIGDILNALRDTHGEKPLQEEKYKRIALAASRAAVAQDRRLSLDEAQGIINQLCRCQHPYQCPQGKPTFVQLSPDELAKQFQKN